MDLPAQTRGRFTNARTWLSWLLLGIMFAGPFIRVNGNPLLLLNFVERQFVILGQVFWPQDMILSAVTTLIFVTGIIVFTAAFRRLWCGWTCPQTVLMEMVFRKIEYFIEGDAHGPAPLAKAPWTAGRSPGNFPSTSSSSACRSSSAIRCSPTSSGRRTVQNRHGQPDQPSHRVDVHDFIHAGLSMRIFARFREQACTFICPYGRFMSTLLDENTIVVAYDHKRGEKRGTSRRSQTVDATPLRRLRRLHRLPPVREACVPRA